MSYKLKILVIAVIAAVLVFSAGSAWAQSNNPITITISSLNQFNDWEIEIVLSTSDDIYDLQGFMAFGEADDAIYGGSATLEFYTLDDDYFTRPGRYYIFLGFWNEMDERVLLSYNMFNITAGHQHIVFNNNLFYDIDLK